MSLAKSFTAQLLGLSMETVTIEVDISNGLNHFSIVGLGDRSVFEAKDRISAAIKNSGYISPKQKNQKVVISLAPADARKEGSAFDLGMAVAYLAAAGDIEFDATGKLFLGELSLEGGTRKVGGILPILCQAKALGFLQAYIPVGNSHEASLARDIEIIPVSSLEETLRILKGEQQPEPLRPFDFASAIEQAHIRRPQWLDLGSIRGNDSAKRGLEIAATGAHNIIMCGPPGTGKTMLAQSFPSILPPLSYEQAVEVTGIHSAARTLEQGLLVYPPFRSPHHTASYPSVVGGGSFPKPGEITLAHRGVLFMDEFAEFDHEVIEALRQPLEDRAITIARARGTVTFPAQCILIASMNPCPCGKGKDHGCICQEHLVKNYWRRISGPIMDRFDIWINVSRVDYDKFATEKSGAERSIVIRDRVIKARSIQQKRFASFGINKIYNSEMNADDIEKCIKISDEGRTTLKDFAKRFEISGRAFHRVLKVARTIADLDNEAVINKQNIMEALQYRQNIR